MSNGLPNYDFLYDNNTFPVSSISGLRDFNKNTMDPSSRTRAGSLQSFIKVVYGSVVRYWTMIWHAAIPHGHGSGTKFSVEAWASCAASWLRLWL